MPGPILRPWLSLTRLSIIAEQTTTGDVGIICNPLPDRVRFAISPDAFMLRWSIWTSLPSAHDGVLADTKIGSDGPI
jgi:hypothetical protein